MSTFQTAMQLRLAEQRLHEFLIAEQIAMHRSVNYPQQLSQRSRGHRRVLISLQSRYASNHEPNFAARHGTPIAGLPIRDLRQVLEYKVSKLLASTVSIMSSIFSGEDNCSIRLGTAALSVPLIVMRMHRRQERRRQREDEDLQRRVEEIRESTRREFEHESIAVQTQEIFRHATEAMEAHFERRYPRRRREPVRM